MSIHRYALQAGQWVQINDQRYFVSSREDFRLDPCRCQLIDLEGKTVIYRASCFRLNGQKLEPTTQIQLLSRESMEEMYGAAKVDAFYTNFKKDESDNWSGLLKMTLMIGHFEGCQFL